MLWKHVDHEHGRRGAPDAAAGGVLPRHRRQLRVPRLLALLPGRQHRVRGARHRHHGDHSGRRGTAPPNGTSSTSARTRRSTSTSWSPASTSTSTARQHGLPTESEPIRSARTTRTASRWCRATPRCAPRSEGKQDSNWRRSGLEGGQQQRHQRARHARRLQAGSGGDPADVRPGLAGLPARQRHRAHALGDAELSPTSVGLRRVRRTSRRRGHRPWRSGPRRTGRSRTPTSCSGTCSASTTSPGRRTGR